MEILLLTLLGAAGVWAVVDHFHDDNSDDHEDDCPPDSDIPDNHSGDTVLQGTPGSDSFTLGSPEAPLTHLDLETGAGADLIRIYARASEIDAGSGDDQITGALIRSEVEAGAGDDLVDLDGSHTQVEGEGGNDHLTMRGDFNTLYGGSGNDTLSGAGMHNSTLYGGEGNDVLEIDSHIRDQGGSHAYGGAGNDILRSGVSHSPAMAMNVLTGGGGADLFHLDLAIDGTTPQDEDGEPAPNHRMLEITDFDPRQDRIEIDLALPPGSPLPEIELIERADGSGTLLRLHHASTHMSDDGSLQAVPLQSDVWLQGARGVTTGAIQLLQRAAA